jgi:DNA-binding transcriptional ArsR family regulator
MSQALLQEPDRVLVALSPLRRELLRRLREPASATQLAAELGLGRQKVNYHLRALEAVGLIELAEERQRRGCVERVLVAAADTFVVDPAVLDEDDRAAPAQDRFAAEHLVATASAVVRDVTRMQSEAERKEQRLLTFTVEAEVRFAEPGDVERFASALADAVASTAAEFDTPDGRPYRLVVGAHPAPKKPRRKAS